MSLYNASEESSTPATPSAGRQILYPKATGWHVKDAAGNEALLSTKAYVDSMLVGLVRDRGTHDASSNVFPSTGGSGDAGAIRKGDLWYVSVAGTLGGTSVNVGDSFRALTDAPGQTASNWSVLESNIGYVPANVAGKLSQFATTTSSELASVISGTTGTGNLVFATGPTITLGNATGLPVSTGISGLGTGVAAALAIAVGTAGSFLTLNGALGTPTSGTVTNLTGTASININGTVGATTPAAGAFTTVSASTSVSTAALKAADGTAAATIANSTGVITIPSSVLTTADINGGTIDGTPIGNTTPSTGKFTSLEIDSASSSLLTFKQSGAQKGYVGWSAGAMWVDVTTGAVTNISYNGTPVVTVGSAGLQVEGTTAFGTSAWPTTVLGKSSDRVLIGNEGALALWNENNAVGAYCSLYLGAKHNSVATAIAGGLIRGGTESTNYSGFLSFLTQNAAGTYVENLRITSAGDRVANKATSQYASGSDGYAILSGGSSASLGAAAVMFGESHATAANELHLRNAGNTTRVKLDANGNLLQVSTGGIGYGTGSGGTVTQATSRTTGVTLNKTNGAITLVSAAGSTSWQSFTLTNSTIAATDVVIVNQKSGTDKYIIHVTAVAAGSCQITFATTGGTTTEQPVFNFAVIKGVTS